jgi:hypothetical protein
MVRGRHQSAIATPRFSLKQRGQSVSMPVGRSTLEIDASPGPACYETRVDSCIKAPCKQTTIPKATRFVQPRPAASPEAGFYDTRPKLRLLLRTAPTVRIAEAKRDINPHNFHAKNARAFLKGIALKAFF